MLRKHVFTQLKDHALLQSPFILAISVQSSHQHNYYEQSVRPSSICHTYHVRRYASSASSTRWKARQAKDHFAREARVNGLKSRAAFKLLQIDEKYKILKKGNTVVDLGYAPGSWSQVAVNRTAPSGRVVGVDILPAQPPRGASTIQGDFLSPDIQAEVRAFVLDPERGRPQPKSLLASGGESQAREDVASTGDDLVLDDLPGYIDMERKATLNAGSSIQAHVNQNPIEDEFCGHGLDRERDRDHMTTKSEENSRGRVVDVVLSDMSEPWEQTSGFWKKSVSDPYYRMMNTSGIPFRDHAGSMDLCNAALSFCFDTLRPGGHFLCKFYQGAEERLFEKKLKRMFEKVHREKPEASRNESREGYFVALRRKAAPLREEIFAE